LVEAEDDARKGVVASSTGILGCMRQPGTSLPQCPSKQKPQPLPRGNAGSADSCCPECGTKGPFYKDGLRDLKDGSQTQRFLCRNCGFRFSTRGQDSKTHAAIGGRSQVCVSIKEAKNLTATESKTVAGKSPLDQQTLKGKLLEFEFWMQKQGYAESTVKTRVMRLLILARRGANILEPESVKAVIALQKTWSDGHKSNVVDAYSCFLEKEGLTWDPPRYKREETIPFIPSEAELNMLIGGCGKTLSIFLQGLKETGADPGELAAIMSKDVNKESRTITLNHPVKGHRPRVLAVSQELIDRLEPLMKKSERLFDDDQLRRAFLYKRRTLVRRLSNPRLRNITFITFRHWFATLEYHRTKDILHVQRLLGHKNIQNTLIYIDLEAKLFGKSSDGFTVRIAHDVGEAAALIESGFEYVTGEYGDGGKIFRKRK
jgi:integrase/DNA-directed RNA polymerase subunit M/transcription elongation factor TFIIS